MGPGLPGWLHEEVDRFWADMPSTGTYPRDFDFAVLELCRLRYAGSAHQWQFAIYRASHGDYHESIFPAGLTIGTCQQASTPPAASASTTPPPGPD